MALFDDTQWAEEYPDYADNTIHMMVFLFAITLFAVLTIALLIYLVVSIINIIIKGIYFGVRFMNADENMLERLFPKKLAVPADAKALNEAKGKEEARLHKIEVEKAAANETAAS